MLISNGVSRGSVCNSDSVSARVEDLQFTLGEGPCIDACELNIPVLEPDLAHPASIRWGAFSTMAVEAGVRAVFGFPIRLGAARLGALSLYHDRVGPLRADQHADALVMAEVAAEVILLVQANATPGQMASELEDGSDFHFVVHQAAGMIAAQLGITVAEALVRLRAAAFAGDAPLVEVARGVVDRTLRLDSPPTSDGAQL